MKAVVGSRRSAISKRRDGAPPFSARRFRASSFGLRVLYFHPRRIRVSRSHVSHFHILSFHLSHFRLSYLIAALLLVFIPFSSNSQTGSEILSPNSNLHRWGALTLFHGLPSDRVRAVAQSADGALWFGTDAGLARYDGRRTQTVRVANDATQPRVNALLLDADGALWIGTDIGAAHLVIDPNDNANLKAATAVDETKGKTITSIVAAGRGRVLLTSADGIVFDCSTEPNEKFKVVSYPATPLTSAETNKQSALALTSLIVEKNANAEDESWLVGTEGRGIMRIARDKAEEIASRPRPFFVNALERAANGRIFLGAKIGRGENALFEATDILRPQRINENTGTVMTIRARGEDLWVGTDARGVFHFRIAPRQTNNSSSNNSSSAPQLVEHFTFENTAGGLRSNHIQAIFFDHEGVVWFGTDKGVCRYDANAPRVETLSSDPESNFVRTLYQTRDGRIIFCGTNRGLFMRETPDGAWQSIAALANESVYDISEDARGHLLVATHDGLFVAPRAAANAKLAFVRAQDASGENASLDEDESDDIDSLKTGSVRVVSEYRGAVYIAVFRRGLGRVDMDDEASQPVSTLVFPNDAKDNLDGEITSLHADDNGKLWIGTARNGVWLLDGERFARAAALDVLKGRAVWAIHGRSANEGLWFATERGLFYYRHGAPRELLEIARGEDVRDVLTFDDSGAAQALCATAGGGVLKVRISDEFGAIVSRLDAEQGLPSQFAFASLLLRGKDSIDAKNGAPSSDANANGAARDAVRTIVIATSRGVVMYNPAHAPAALYPTRIIGKRAYAPEELRGELLLDYPQNSLVLEAAAMSSRTFAEQFQYAFLLRDAEGKTIARKLSHDAQFQMLNLKPGRYRVTARAYNADLVPSAPLEFAFEVARAPFPRTTVALSSLLALSFVALWWGWRQNRRIRRASAELAEANRELASARQNLAHETEAERRRIARDLHDQTLADLRRLALMSDELAAMSENGNGRNGHLSPARFRAEVEAISTEVRRICEDLSPSVLENIGLAAALEFALAETVAHLPASKKFEYEFACDDAIEERLPLAPSVKIQIYRIVQEALNNISRHADAKRVNFTVSIADDDALSIEINDDGRGFDLAETMRAPHAQGRGLANMRARADLINARLAWQRREANGSRFSLKVPSLKFQVPSHVEESVEESEVSGQDSGEDDRKSKIENPTT
jgi:signal transduction histidine kinase/ligand-binding sensor domain-containing protein